VWLQSNFSDARPEYLSEGVVRKDEA